MTFGTERRTSFDRFDHRRLPPNALPQRVLGGAAAVFVAALCAWTVCNYVGAAADRTDDPAKATAGRGDRLAMVSRRGDKLAIARPDSPWSYYALLFDPHRSTITAARFTDDGSFESNIRPVALTTSSPPANPIIAELAPVRSDRPIRTAVALPPRSTAMATRGVVARTASAETAAERPGFF